MALAPNRVGITPGPDARTLTDIYNLLADIKAELVIIKGHASDTADSTSSTANALGDPTETDCNMPILQLLCERLPPVDGPIEEPYFPVFRCGNLYLGKCQYAFQWRLEPAFPLSGDGFWCPDTWYTGPGEGELDIDAAIVELPDTGEGVGVVVFRSPNPERGSVCIEAKNPAGSVWSVFWNRYSVSTGALITSGSLGVVDPSELWTEGVNFAVESDSYYTFHPSINEGFDYPDEFELYISQGALG